MDDFNLQQEINEFEELYSKVLERGNELLDKYLKGLVKDLSTIYPFDKASYVSFELDGVYSSEQYNLRYSVFVPINIEIVPDRIIGNLSRVIYKDNTYWKITVNSLYEGPKLSILPVFLPFMQETMVIENN